MSERDFLKRLENSGKLQILRVGKDIDCLTNKENLKTIEEFLISEGFVKLSKRFYHEEFKKIYPKMEVDLQFGGLNQNNLIFLNEKYFIGNNYPESVKKSLGLLIHLIVNKGEISPRRKIEFFRLFNKLSLSDFELFISICLKEYGENITNKIKEVIEKKKVNLKILKWQIIFKKSNIFQILILPKVLISNQIYKFKQKRKKYILSFMGVDGSGKTTSINNLSLFFDKNNINHLIGNLGVYHQRTKFMRLLSLFIKREKNKKDAIKKLNLNYSFKSPFKNIIRIIDIYLRYKKIIKKSKKNDCKIILFDRYFYDIILQSKLDFISRRLLKLIPKPDKLFFLSGNPKDIFKRKRERTIKGLSKQMSKFREEIKEFTLIDEIESRNKDQTLKEILIKLNNKKFLRCM